mgnify:CR=1 FL=1
MKYIKPILLTILTFLAITFSPIYFRYITNIFQLNHDEGFPIFMSELLVICGLLIITTWNWIELD